MKKKAVWICAAIVAVALLVFLLTLLLPGRDTPASGSTGTTTGETGRTQPTEGTGTQSTADTADGQLSVEPSGTQPSAPQSTQGSAGGDSQPDKTGTQPTSDGTPEPTVSAGVVEDWPDDPDTTVATEPKATDPSKETDPKESDKETEPKPTGSDKETEPGKETEPKKELTDLTYAQYLSLSAEDQQAFYEAFPSDEAFFAWYREAKAVYDAQQAEGVIVDGDGNIDISDYIGGN